MNPKPRSALGPVLSILLAVNGCAGHVQLKAPPANASGQERVAAYDDLRPIDYKTVTSAKGRYTDVVSLELNDGTKVRLPEDLLPLVPPDSPAAQSMRDARSYRHKNQLLALGGYGGLIGGLILAAVGGGMGSKPVAYGGLGIAIGGVICLPFVNGQANKANASTAQAYEQYDDGLRRKLDLCEEGERVVPCR
jgi:hypothetical protein